MQHLPQSVPVLVTAAACTGSIHASLLAVFPNCDPSAGKADCGLASFLPWLYFAAAALAIILIAVVALAMYAYRRNKKTEIEPR